MGTINFRHCIAVAAQCKGGCQLVSMTKCEALVFIHMFLTAWMLWCCTMQGVSFMKCLGGLGGHCLCVAKVDDVM